MQRTSWYRAGTAITAAIAMVVMTASQAHAGTVVGANDASLNVSAFNIVGGGGSNDNDLNTVGEANQIWDSILSGNGPGLLPTIVANTKVYGIHRNESDVETVVNYGGGGGNFGGNIGYGTINSDGPGGGGGSITGGDQFSVRAQAFLRFNVGGTYTLAAGSDDGRRVDLSGVPAMSPGYTGVTATGGQISGPLSATMFGFDGLTGHDTSRGAFTVAAGDVLALDSFFFERGGGDSFELSIAPGNTVASAPPGGYSLLTDGALGGAVSVSTNTAFSDTNFTVKSFQLGGSTTAINLDKDITSGGEAATIWAHLDANPGFTGDFVQNATPQNKNYNVANIETDTESSPDYAGNGGGNFGVNLSPASINDDGPGGGGGSITGGDDYSIRADGWIEFKVGGTYSLSVASDDGRLLTLTDINGDPVNFIAANDQIDIGGPGTNTIGFGGSTGHDQTIGAFTVNAGDFIHIEALFYERAGGDSFELAIKAGNDVTFDGGFELLTNSALGGNTIMLHSSAVLIPEPMTAGLALMGVGGLSMAMRRRRAAA